VKFQSRVLVASPIDYGLCFEEADFRKTLKKLGLPLEEQPGFCASKAGASTHYFPGAIGSRDIIIVTLNDTSGYSVTEVNSLLVHEAVHVFQHIKSHIGETCSINEGYEFEAYSIQAISYNLMAEFEDYELKLYEKAKKAKAAKKAAKKEKKAE
jgi:hypothetical protein